MAFWRKDDAQAQLLGFMIGTAIFSGAFLYVVQTAVEDPLDTETAEAADLSLRANAIADAIFERGQGWYSSVECVATANPLPDYSKWETTAFTPNNVGISGRFGLGEEDCEPSYSLNQYRNRLAFSKVNNVFDANITYAISGNGVVDYPEARSSLQLDKEYLGFQVRAWPVLANIRQMLDSGEKDKNMRVLYIGLFNTAGSPKTPNRTALREIQFLDALVEDFDAAIPHDGYGDPGLTVPSTTQIPRRATGDVYPAIGFDIRTHASVAFPLETALTTMVGGVPLYNTLVIGSYVEQSELNGHSLPDYIDNWVKAGGTLIALGGPAQGPSSFMNAKFGTRQEDTNDRTVSVATHPVLRTPNRLDTNEYKHGTFWVYKSNDYAADFTQVVKDNDPSTGKPETVMGVGKPGEFGKGRIHITSWRPGDLMHDDTGCTTVPPEETCQGLFLIHNLLTLSYERIYMEYGPDPPETEGTSSTLRIATIYHPTLKKDLQVAVQVLVFRQA